MGPCYGLLLNTDGVDSMRSFVGCPEGRLLGQPEGSSCQLAAGVGKPDRSDLSVNHKRRRNPA